MQSQTLGGAVGIILIIWYALWRVGLVREWMRRAGIGRHRETKP